MDYRYASFKELLASTRDADKPVRVIIWQPDGRFDRVRTVEIEHVGFTQISRRPFSRWSQYDHLNQTRDQVIDYIATMYGVTREAVGCLDMDIIWSDKKWVEKAREVADA